MVAKESVKIVFGPGGLSLRTRAKIPFFQELVLVLKIVSFGHDTCIWGIQGPAIRSRSRISFARRAGGRSPGHARFSTAANMC